MKATELRIGNYVMYNGVIYTVESILSSTYLVFLHTLDKEILMEAKMNRIDPVNLTGEWLEKFKFEKIGSHYEKEKLIAFPYIGYGADMSLSFSEDWVDLDVRCDYVHQLQNLYFAIISKELTINR